MIHEQEFEPPEALNLEIEPYEFDPYEDELPAAADPEGMRGVNTSKYGQFLEIILYDNSVTVPDNKHKLGSILIKLKDDIKIAKTEEDFQTDPERWKKEKYFEKNTFKSQSAEQILDELRKREHEGDEAAKYFLKDNSRRLIP